MTDARNAAERLRASIEAMPFQAAPGVTHVITVSIGVAYTDKRDTTPEQILQAADQAMYRAKHDGRNRVVATAA
jgi:two-component system cell cycle response regulator